MFFSGVPVWPQHNHAKYILLTWVLVTLILDFGKPNMSCATMFMFFGKHIFSAYSGCLVASLTLPKRCPLINTFQELLNQKDITIVGSQNSFMDYLNQTSDSVLMVLLLTILNNKRIRISSFQELNNRMLQQGHNETHLYKPNYRTFTHKVLLSQTPVVRMQELTMAKLFNAIRWSKASGKLNCGQVCKCLSKPT